MLLEFPKRGKRCSEWPGTEAFEVKCKPIDGNDASTEHAANLQLKPLECASWEHSKESCSQFSGKNESKFAQVSFSKPSQHVAVGQSYDRIYWWEWHADLNRNPVSPKHFQAPAVLIHVCADSGKYAEDELHVAATANTTDIFKWNQDARLF